MENYSLPDAHYTDWLYLLLLACGTILLICKSNAPKRFNAFSILPFYTKKLELLSEFNPFNSLKRFETLLSLHSYLLLALAIFVIKVYLQDDLLQYGNYMTYIRILFFVLLFFLTKALANAFLEWVYGHDGQITLSGNLNLGYRIWASILLLPLIFLNIFLSQFHLIFTALIGFFLVLTYTISVFQSNIILWKMPSPSYYKIFYICALEISPIFFLITWLF
jgi:hypothetical protein